MKAIVVTGGGSGGHIAPIRAIAPELMKTKKLIWIGSSDFEKNAAVDLGIKFKKIYSGKMRRGFNLGNIFKNIVDIFRVEYGAWQSLFFLLKVKPEKIFSTGGFVSVPVVIAAWLLRIPIIIHEQTIGFGLANKIGASVAQKILLAFSESRKYIPEKHHHNIEAVGNPIRAELMNGNIENLQKFLKTDLSDKKPILYVTGGGQGSQLINNVIFELLPKLTSKYYVIHQCGKSGIAEARKQNYADYFPFEFIGSELADIYTCADIVIARSGAGTVNELSYFGIYSIFVPLQPVQNDEQMKNAKWFLKNNDKVNCEARDGALGCGEIIEQSEFNAKDLSEILRRNQITQLRRNKVFENREHNSAQKILEFLK